MTEAIIYPCPTCINMFLLKQIKKNKMAAKIRTKWRPKRLQLWAKCVLTIMMAGGKLSPGRGIKATIIFT